jgi:hypothetical protein
MRTRKSAGTCQANRKSSHHHEDYIGNDPSAPTDMSAEYRALVSKHLALLEMNKDLNDALLRMRKKLLSLSTASAAAAG